MNDKPIELTGLQRLQIARHELADIQLTKGGYNDHDRRAFWQLADFVPHITKLCVKHKLTPIFSMIPTIFKAMDFYTEQLKTSTKFRKPGFITSGVAQLLIKDSIDSNIIAEFSCPLSSANLPGGAQEIMNRGAEITYFRRYMYMIAFDITEPDMVDSAKSILVNSLKQVDYDNLHNATSVNTLNSVATALQQTYPKAIVAIEYDIAKKKLLKEKDSKTAFKPKGGVSPDGYKSSLL